MEREVVDTLKGKLITPPAFGLSRRDGQYIFEMDACNTQVTCVLLQEQGAKALNPTDYWPDSSAMRGYGKILQTRSIWQLHVLHYSFT